MKEHSMTADELRALADALEHECALRLIAGGKNHEEAQACEQAADYLRAQADALPVGVYEYRSAEMRYGVRWLVDELTDGTPLYAYPAPTEPPAEPKREALRGLAPTHRCPACGAFWRQCDDASWNLRSASCCGLCDAGRVELVCWPDDGSGK